MPLVRCPHCRKQLSVQSTSAGKQCKCPHCTALLRIPASVTPPGAAQTQSKLPISTSGEAETIPPKPDMRARETVPPIHPAVAGPAEDQNIATVDTTPRSPDLSKHAICVPGYEFLGELGRGGMGVVYKATHLKLNRIVALKMILAGGHAGSDDLKRFLSEAEAVAGFQHRNNVQVHDVGQHQDLPFMALEFVSGGSLADKIKHGPIPAKETAQLVEQIARGMNTAHQGGIVHRDLKPDNVLLTEDGTPKVTDFGLAKKVDGGPDLTRTGAIMGTPSYMAPEQAGGEGKRVGPAADVYALGAVLYACLTGRPPFQSDSVMNTLLQVMSQEPVPPRQLNKGIPVDLEVICLKCLEKDPLKRYASAHNFAEDLRSWQAGEPITARPVDQLERVVKWVKRRPAQAGLAATLTSVLLLILIGAPLLAWHQYNLRYAAEKARKTAETEKIKAKKKEGEAIAAAKREREAKIAAEKARVRANHERDKAQTAAYAMRLLGVQQALRQGNVNKDALELLGACHPKSRGWEHDHLRMKGLGVTQVNIKELNGVRNVAFSPDGKQIVSASHDRTLIVWDTTTQQ